MNPRDAPIGDCCIYCGMSSTPVKWRGCTHEHGHDFVPDDRGAEYWEALQDEYGCQGARARMGIYK